ncbi:MAG: 4Fe-4S binding protein, partial [Armatimonadetes bacterium]|nr:4Fe-4S binding protein [Armatimonadota bacterium]
MKRKATDPREQRGPTIRSGKGRFMADALAVGPIRGMLMSPAFPFALQIATLAGLIWLAANGLGIGIGASKDDLMTLRKTNLTTLAVWGLWWPGLIAATIALGRVWCTVCPLELVNRAADGIGRWTGMRRPRLGRFLRAGGIVVLAYLILQVLVAGIAIHRVPHFTSVMLLILLGVAAITGLLFREPRSFCRAFCPAGGILSVYGRYTPIQLETRDGSVCEECTTRDCVRADNRSRFDRRSCPSLISPHARRQSDGCVLCLQCAKVCPHRNIGFGVVRGDAPVRRKGLLLPFEAAFVMVALGFVAHDTLAEVKWADAVFHRAPEAIAALAPGVAFGWYEALWFLVLFPALAWAAIAAAAFLLGQRGGLGTLLLAAATGAAPVVALAHVAKSAAKIASWGGYLPGALADPNGMETFRRISADAISKP